jgi:hypothetical protein
MPARVSEPRRTRFMLEEAIVDGAASIDRRQMLGMRKMTEAKAYGARVMTLNHARESCVSSHRSS